MQPPKEALGNGRQAYVNSIPEQLKEWICTCPANWDSDSDLGIKFVWSEPGSGVLVCDTCKRPRHLWTYIEVCDNCEHFYIVEQFPDGMLLCPDCK